MPCAGCRGPIRLQLNTTVAEQSRNIVTCSSKRSYASRTGALNGETFRTKRHPRIENEVSA